VTGGIVWGLEQSTDGRSDRFDTEIAYAVKAEVHLWGAVIAHKISEQGLDNLTAGNVDGPLLLDVESMLTIPLIGCLVCEEPFTAKLRRRKCPGEPSR
jgi:hypothetical protein